MKVLKAVVETLTEKSLQFLVAVVADLKEIDVPVRLVLIIQNHVVPIAFNVQCDSTPFLPRQSPPTIGPSEAVPKPEGNVRS
ncbi:MAG TPA: hypothetical protein VGK74_19670 [Symbiobacteriaceae bacterium]